MRTLRHQLPVYSPLSLRGIVGAAAGALQPSSDPRSDLVGVLKREYQADDVVLCGSGTQALQLALVIAGKTVESPGPVALPAYTCFDVATAAVGAEARIHLYDIDPTTLSPDLDSLEQALRGGARVVVISPLFGCPVNWDAVEEIVARHGAVAIEDAAQGHGSTWRGKPLGSLGRLSVLSLGRGKGWTGGQGGALLVREKTTSTKGVLDGRSRLEHLAELGLVIKVLAQWFLGRASLYSVPASLPWLGLGKTRYRDPVRPRTITRAAAALAEFGRREAAAEVAVRRENAAALLKGLRFRSAVRPIQVIPDAQPGFLRLPLRLQWGLAGFLQPGQAVRLGLARGYPSVLAALPEVRVRTVGGKHEWPGGEELAKTLLTVPTHSKCLASERDRLLCLINSYPSAM